MPSPSAVFNLLISIEAQHLLVNSLRISIAILRDT